MKAETHKTLLNAVNELCEREQVPAHAEKILFAIVDLAHEVTGNLHRIAEALTEIAFQKRNGS